MAIELTILGSSSGLPTPDRFATAQVININERFFLVDCGEGTQIQMKRFRVKTAKINHIFISHLHGDHIFGLFGLLSSYNLWGRTATLYLHTQKEHEAILNAVLNMSEFQYELKLCFYDPTKVSLLYEDKGLTITSFPVKHRAPTVGFLFQEKQKQRGLRKSAIEEFNLTIEDILAIKDGSDFISEEGNTILNKYLTVEPPPARSYAFMTDTVYTEDVLPIIKNVDLLYHEATFSHDKLKLARMTGHSTALQAATLAKKAKAKQLLIGHFSLRYKELDSLLHEARLEYPEVMAAYDGMQLKIK